MTQAIIQCLAGIKTGPSDDIPITIKLRGESSNPQQHKWQNMQLPPTCDPQGTFYICLAPTSHLYQEKKNKEATKHGGGTTTKIARPYFPSTATQSCHPAFFTSQHKEQELRAAQGQG